MKKIIIMFMAISMLLVSCQINAPIDDVSVTTPTNNPSGDNENTDNGNDTTPTDTDDEDSITPTDGDTTHGNPSGDNENTDNGSDVTNNTDVNYFEPNGDANNFTYKVKYGASHWDNVQFTTPTMTAGSYKLHVTVNENENKIIFEYYKYNNTIANLKVHNVSVNGNVVTIELVNNN